jgi:AraC-like DNA-binding protein
MLSTFAERIWGQGSYTTVVTDRSDRAKDSLLTEVSRDADADGILAEMRIIEERYKFENELISAVEEGRYGKLETFMAGFREASFEKRVADPLRNMKNYGIITNTLLRKGAERGGVHPLDIDRLSSAYAIKIEQCPSESECLELFKEMLRGYCRLVNKHKGARLSPIVQKAVAIIDSDISRELSLSAIADATNISPGYLCSIFKRDMGKTVTEYITERRMKHAEYLLSSTHLQIQTVALYTGIMDVQYFSKLFKKHSGFTPKEYRDRNRRN